ncbi:hypothetical protein [Nannocystis sp.]|uniref:hypothetical protein n=1 Tax=Nannocystis sp. TaxID=1962667 RepID=UPI002421D78E|nr:hypothetical protein [Nannocystis sp.]MBK7826467.1 hypothetical protein [Nannocystis sp.]MBK9757983.1 hypothetical protein [Nannocystis sp.]
MRRALVVWLLASGCVDRTLGGDGADGSSAGEVTGSGDDGTPTSGPVTVTVTTADPSAPGTSDPTTVSTSTSTTSPPDPTITTSPTTVTTTTSTTDVTASASDTDSLCGDPPGLPNNASCTDPTGCGCASGKCFVVPILGGFCGECLGDADCSPGGCTPPDPVNGIGSRCNKGEPGAGCESDAVCSDPQHPHCAPVLVVQGILDVSTCSACKTNLDCPPAAHNCTPIYDIPNFTGLLECVADGAIPNGAGCNLSDNGQGQPIGDEACASGLCGTANVMGLLDVGVCGECRSNADCPPNLPQCSDPQVDLNAGVLIPAQCF